MTSQHSYAKTQGLNVGLHYVIANARYKTVFKYTPANYNQNGTYVSEPTSYNMHGASLDVGYAFNMNNFFIAPGAFFEQSSFGGDDSIDNDTDERVHRGMKVQHRFGAKVDIGYDIAYSSAGDISPYITGGYAAIKYKSKETLPDFAPLEPAETVNQDYDHNWFIGAGLKVDLADNMALNMEYNWQQFDLSSAIPNRGNFPTHYESARHKGDLNIVKVGIILGF